MKKSAQCLMVAGLALILAGCHHQVTLTIRETSTGVTSFIIYRGSTCTTLLELGTTTAESYVDQSVSAGDTYCYAARAVGAGGTSAESNTVTLTIP